MILEIQCAKLQKSLALSKDMKERAIIQSNIHRLKIMLKCYIKK